MSPVLIPAKPYLKPRDRPKPCVCSLRRAYAAVMQATRLQRSHAGHPLLFLRQNRFPAAQPPLHHGPAPFAGLAAISALGPNDIWAVGCYNPDPYSVYQPLTIHWTGAAWTVVPAPANPQAETTLQGVGAVATNDVWAVGESEDGPLIMHWDG